MESSLFTVCMIAFAAVMGILLSLAVAIRLLMTFFPDHSPEADSGLMEALGKAIGQAYPGATLVKVELEEIQGVENAKPDSTTEWTH